MSTVPNSAEPVLEEGATLVGRYRLVRLLGEGGMGYVWEGRHLTTEKPVAIKALKGETDADVARLLREAKLSASLMHRNIVQVFDFWEPEGNGPVFMVMELLRGQSLGEYLRRSGKLTFDESRTVGLAVAAAMRFAHAKGIVHRDLKPDNVFLAQTEDEAVPDIKVLDFGIAKPTVADAQLTAITRTGSVIGTPHYMAPEQIYAEKDLDGRADVWALGVILYECLAGIKPFDGDSFGQVFRQVTRGEVRPLAEVAPTVPRAMCSLVMSMLAVERPNRPTSASVHEALEGLGSGTAAQQQTQWLPPRRPPSGVFVPTPSHVPSPSQPPFVSGGQLTPPALAAAPSVAPYPSGNSPLVQLDSTKLVAIAGGVVALVAVVVLGVVLAWRTTRTHSPEVDRGATVVPASSGASTASTPSSSAPPAPPQPVDSLPTAVTVPSAPRVAHGVGPQTLPATTASARAGSKALAAPRSAPSGDPLGAGRF